MAIKLPINEEDYPTYEDLPEGDYYVELQKLPDDEVLRTIYKRDADGNATPIPEMIFINWNLTVLSPTEWAGRRIFHSTMWFASKEKIAQAASPYNPMDMTLSFLQPLGVVEKIRDGNKTVKKIKKEFTDKNGSLDFSKLPWGDKFWVRYVDKVAKNGKVFRQVTTVWKDANDDSLPF